MDNLTLDQIVTIVAVFAAVFLPIISFLYAKWQDPMWRASIARRWLRSNMWYIGLVSRDGNMVRQLTLNVDSAAFSHKGSLWVFIKGRAKRATKVEKGNKYIIDEANPQQIVLDSDEMKTKTKWVNESVPAIYLSEDDWKPIDFIGNAQKLDPMEVDASYNTWEMNQKKKDMIKGDQTMLIMGVVMILALAAAALGFFSMQNADAAQKIGLSNAGDLALIKQKLGLLQAVNNTIASNTTLVIDATK